MEIKRIKRAKKEAGSASYPQEKRDGTQTVCSSNDCQNRHRQIDKTEEPKVFLEQRGTLCGREPHPSCPPPEAHGNHSSPLHEIVLLQLPTLGYWEFSVKVA